MRIVIYGLHRRWRRRSISSRARPAERASRSILEKAAPKPVAGTTSTLDLKEEHIAITIGKPAFDLLGVAARFALEPELLS